MLADGGHRSSKIDLVQRPHSTMPGFQACRIYLRTDMQSVAVAESMAQYTLNLLSESLTEYLHKIWRRRLNDN